MDARLQKRVQRYGWDKAASHYEHAWQAQLGPLRQPCWTWPVWVQASGSWMSLAARGW